MIDEQTARTWLQWVMTDPGIPEEYRDVELPIREMFRMEQFMLERLLGTTTLSPFVCAKHRVVYQAIRPVGCGHCQIARKLDQEQEQEQEVSNQ